MDTSGTQIKLNIINTIDHPSLFALLLCTLFVLALYFVKPGGGVSHSAASLGVQTRKLVKHVASGEHCLEQLEGRKAKREETKKMMEKTKRWREIIWENNNGRENGIQVAMRHSIFCEI